MDPTLEKLFGSSAKVKIMKLFLFNPDTAYDTTEVSFRSKVGRGLARREISNLEKAGFLKQKSYNKEILMQKNKRMVSSQKKSNGYVLNYKFEYLEPLYNFLSDINVYKHEDLIERLSKGVKLQLLIIAGLFIKETDSRVDMLIVGDNIKENIVENVIRNVESEIGREIKYVILETSEFKYRLSVFDKLIRDVLDYPHQKILNKINL